MEVQVREERHDPTVPRLGLTRNIGVGRLLRDTPVLRTAARRRGDLLPRRSEDSA